MNDSILNINPKLNKKAEVLYSGFIFTTDSINPDNL